MVGATGALRETRDDADGTRTFRFHQEDVHDFAWTASRRFVEKKGRFDGRRATRRWTSASSCSRSTRTSPSATSRPRAIALRSYGAWSAPYPYAQITVVDPAWGSGVGRDGVPDADHRRGEPSGPRRALQSPESVTIHEAGHQFWYGLVATNEFEEAWLDEGFNRYHDRKADALAYGPRGWGERYFGLRRARGAQRLAGGGAGRRRRRAARTSAPALRRHGRDRRDGAARVGLPDADSYGLNAYGKPALSLQTLEGLLGDETMTRILRTYARRYRFAHPIERGLHRHRERGHGPGLALVLRPDVVLGRAVRLRGRR